ncbi:MAG: hypothetical protein JRH20_16335 [Deltaproteobacteria bacterium]|nr:hypothetical protein [Deltaproteobacteria bacterium]
MPDGSRHVECSDCHNPHTALAGRDSGTATGSTGSSLTDSSKNGSWQTNQWAGYALIIGAGTGAGQTQTITGNNTSGTVNVASWSGGAGQPTSGSTYRITRMGSDDASGANVGARGVTVSSRNAYSVGAAAFVGSTIYSGASGGIVTSASTGTSVQASTMFWPPNQWNGYTFYVVSGTGAGQSRTISANANASLTLNSSVSVGTNSVFSIYQNGAADNAVWSSAMNGGMVRNGLDRNGRWYQLSGFSTIATGLYSFTLSPSYSAALSDTKLTSNTGAQWYMDFGTNYNISYATFTATAAATKEQQICLNCHSQWAYGNAPPDTPSGHLDSSSVAQTDVSHDFGDQQLGYHPIFAMGKNQPNVSYSGWNVNAPFTRVDNTGPLTFGLSNTFTTGWFKESLVRCSDCHSSDSNSDPLGPHASGKKWLIKGIDTGISWVRRNSSGTGWETITNADLSTSGSTDAGNYCLNCHRWDVYGWVGLRGSAPASTLTRVPHDPTDHAKSFNGSYLPPSGIVCNHCHGGDRLGGIHGSNRRKYPYAYDPSTDTANAIGSSGPPASYSGRRLLNGAYWYGVTRATTTSGTFCWGKAGTDVVSACAYAHEGVEGGFNANYSYEDTDP